jgi:arylsulfatase A-like enzyme
MLRDWYKIDKRTLSPQAIALARDAYDHCIVALDRELGKLFAELNRRGVLDDTVVIVTADHGEQFGEHGHFGHGLSLHAPEVHVPLVVFSPRDRNARGRSIADGVSLRDIPATILDLLGFENESPFPGQSLARVWQSPTKGGALVTSPPLSELHAPIPETTEPQRASRVEGPTDALLAEKSVYIRHQGGDEELYDVDADAAETHDLSERAEARAALERCRSMLEQLMGG